MKPEEQIKALAEDQNVCPACGGDGIETCDNPDHSFIGALGGEVSRLGCPCCGHDPNFKMSGPCPECAGSGKQSIVSSNETICKQHENQQSGN